MYQNFSAAQIDKLLSLDPKTYDTAEKLVKVLNDISKYKPPKEILSTDQIQAKIDEATQNYAQLEDIKDKINSGKDLSSTEGKNLQEQHPELMEYFDQMIDGTYKLKTSAEEFKKAVEEIEFQPFLDNLQHIKDSLSQLPSQNVLQNLSQEQSQLNGPFSQQGFEDNQKQAAQTKLDFISQNDDQGLNVGLQNWVSEQEKLLESGENL